MGFLDFLQNASSAYNGQSNSGGGTAGWPGVPYRMGDQNSAPQTQATSIPGTSAQPGGNSNGLTGGVGNYANSVGIPGQANFDAIQKSIMAQQSPYVSFGANGYLQNNHPGIAHALDNAFLAAANTTSGSTAAENIAGVAKGVIGGRQESLQHNVQQALLPVELAQRQLAYQKQYLDVGKDQAQIGEANSNAFMNNWRGQNFQRLANSATSPYSTTKIGDDGQMWGVRKDNGRQELVPGQPSDGQTGDPGGGAPSTGTFPVPGTSGRNPTITSLAADVANNVPGAEARLRAAINASNAAAGGKTNAVINATTPKDLLQSESKAALDQVGAPPKSSKDDYQSFMASQLVTGVPFSKIPDQDTWEKTAAAKYNSAKSQAQQDISDYTKSKAWQHGMSMQQWKAMRARTAQTPGAAKQAAPAGMPGTTQQQAPNPNDPLGFQPQR